MNPSSPQVEELRRAFVRFNALTLAVTFGLLVGLGLAGATLILVVKGGPNTGATLNLLRQYLPGYAVTLPGAFVGFAWAFGFGALLAYLPARIYYRGALRAARTADLRTDARGALGVSTPIHVPSFAAAAGLFFGSTLFLATVWLVLKHAEGEPLGPHLGLLRYYIPGYSVSFGGAAVGLVWVFVLAAVAFALVGWVYNRLHARTGGEA